MRKLMGDDFIMTDVDHEYCTCENPTGFRFLEYGESHQVWIHIICGKKVVRALIKSGRY